MEDTNVLMGEHSMVEEECPTCGEEGLHVCLPDLVTLLKEDKGFQDLVKEMVIKK